MNCFVINISTDEDVYSIFVLDYNPDDINPDNEGVYMLEIWKSSYNTDNMPSVEERMSAGIRILED